MKKRIIQNLIIAALVVQNSFCADFSAYSIKEQFRKYMPYIVGGVAVATLVVLPIYYWYAKKKATQKRYKECANQILSESKSENYDDNEIKSYQEKLNAFIEDNPLMENFVRQYTPSKNLLKQIIAHEDLIFNNPVQYNKSQDDFFVKDERVMRVALAARMRNYIRKKGYTYVAVPEKYVVLIHGRLRVITRKIDFSIMDASTEIDLTMMKELADVVMNTGYVDFGPLDDYPNLVIDKQSRKLTFIDMELRSYHRNLAPSNESALQYLDEYLKKCGACLTDDAREWMRKMTEKLERKQRIGKESSILDLEDCDESGISFVNVYQYQCNNFRDCRRFYHVGT